MISGSDFKDEVRNCARDPGRRCEKQALIPPCVEQIVRNTISAAAAAQQVIRSSARISSNIADNLKKSAIGTA